MTKRVKIWQGGNEIGDPAKIQELPCVTHIVTHRAQKGHYQFLLGNDLCFHQNILFCGWGNSRVNENDNESIMACRSSDDHGLTWGKHTVIAPGSTGLDSHSHGVFVEHNGALFALVPRAHYDAQGAEYPALRTELFKRNASTEQWNSQGIVIENQQFWPLSRPQKMSNSNLIMTGLICPGGHAEPAVAISKGSGLHQWEIIQIPTRKRPDNWGEGALIDFEGELWFIFRNGWKHAPLAQLSISRDHGRTWSRAQDTNIPVAQAKTCCGILKNKRPFIIFNHGKSGRQHLLLALGDSGQKCFNTVYRIRYGKSPEARFSGRGKSPQWAYPCALEQDGKLFVSYASSKEDAVTSIIDINQLA